MKYLLDTHTWIWWNMNPGKLSKKVKMLINDIEGYDEPMTTRHSTVLVIFLLVIWDLFRISDF